MSAEAGTHSQLHILASALDLLTHTSLAVKPHRLLQPTHTSHYCITISGVDVLLLQPKTCGDLKPVTSPGKARYQCPIGQTLNTNNLNRGPPSDTLCCKVSAALLVNWGDVSDDTVRQGF